MRVHFMGIGGSGMSGVAQIAQSQGFTVTGCDLQQNTPYLEKLHDISVLHGHSPEHIQDVDILAVTPAIFFQNSQNPELLEGKKKDMVMTWQQFMGQYLHKDKYIICVAGTHGKSTTTTMVGLTLEAASLDPIVEVGATVPDWHSNVRLGKGKYFVSESDEYYHNFLHYHPDVIILNNIELDHPEYFKDFDNLLKAYLDFVNNLKPNGVLIYNADDMGNQKLVSFIKDEEKNIQLIPYSLKDIPHNLQLGVPGDHNKTNAMGVIKLGKLLKLDSQTVLETLAKFQGIGRRLELLGEKNNIKVYDDYANLPTAFAANIAAIKEKHPDAKVWAIIEPHTYSRLRAVLDQLPESVKQADEVIVTKVFASREQDPGDFSGQDIANTINSRYLPDFTEVIKTVKSEAKSGDVILVMGSGDSYKLSRSILEGL